MDKNFNVLDMVEETGTDMDDLFKSDKKEEAKVEVASAELSPTEQKAPIDNRVKEEKPKSTIKPKDTAWSPDESLTEDMPELQQTGIVLNKDEFKEHEDGLINNADEALQKNAFEKLDNLDKANYNIEVAKKRHGIDKLQIDQNKLDSGSIFAQFMLYADDPDFERAQAGLDDMLNKIKAEHPEYILSYLPGYGPEGKLSEVETTATEEAPIEESTKAAEAKPPVKDTYQPTQNEEDLKIVIDKTNLSQIAFNAEEVEKIKKSRTIELNIVENGDIEFGSIINADSNTVDMVLEKYQRRTNESVAALPASKYRCSFSGLTYAQVIDLNTAMNLDSIDAERLKWSLCFEHMKNPSIGKWDEYVLYTDPDTNKEMRAMVGAPIPSNARNQHTVTAFEDFLKKTSYLDVNFMLWKILCATCMDKEIVSVTCHSTLKNSDKTCGHVYDWVYSPEALLDQDSITPTLMKEINDTLGAQSMVDIQKIYQSSPVQARNYVELPTSKFKIIYGHASAYEYINDIYAKIEELKKMEDDPKILSKSIAIGALTTVKAILVPQEDGTHIRITGADNILKVLNKLDEVDWSVISQLSELMNTPYNITYTLKDVICPKCGGHSSIPIGDMKQLLFIVAQGLETVQVKLHQQ